MIGRFKSLSPGLRKGLKIFFILCVLVILPDLIINKHGGHWWNFFGFHGLYGFLACVVLVLAAARMRKPLMRDEHYYRDDQDD